MIKYFLSRYIPNNFTLAISELDEKHISVLNFRNRESLINLVSSKTTIEKVRITLVAQVCQKYLLMSAIQQVSGCYNEIRQEEKTNKLPLQPTNQKLSTNSSTTLFKRSNKLGMFALFIKLASLVLAHFIEKYSVTRHDRGFCVNFL